MQKIILEEKISYENGMRVHTQLIEQRTTKSEDMLEVGQLHMTLGRLESQIESLIQKMAYDVENETAYKAQIERLQQDQMTITAAIAIHNEYIAGFDKE